MDELKKVQLGVHLMELSRLMKELINESNGLLDSDTVEMIKRFGELCTVTATSAEVLNSLRSELNDLESMRS